MNHTIKLYCFSLIKKDDPINRNICIRFGDVLLDQKNAGLFQKLISTELNYFPVFDKLMIIDKSKVNSNNIDEFSGYVSIGNKGEMTEIIKENNEQEIIEHKTYGTDTFVMVERFIYIYAPKNKNIGILAFHDCNRKNASYIFLNSIKNFLNSHGFKFKYKTITHSEIPSNAILDKVIITNYKKIKNQEDAAIENRNHFEKDITVKNPRSIWGRFESCFYEGKKKIISEVIGDDYDSDDVKIIVKIPTSDNKYRNLTVSLEKDGLHKFRIELIDLDIDNKTGRPSSNSIFNAIIKEIKDIYENIN